MRRPIKPLLLLFLALITICVGTVDPSAAPSSAPTIQPTTSLASTVVPSYAPAAAPSSYLLTTLTGSGSPTSNAGDGGKASAASVVTPSGVFITSSGSVYLSDSVSRIRVIDINSDIITTFAGSDAATSTGDDGPLTAATLKGPYGLWGDSVGNLYFTETTNYRIRRISTSGLIISRYAGVGTAATAATLANGDGGQATSAVFGTLYYISGDTAGNLYIPDYSMHKVRRVAPDGIISLVVGTGSFGSSGDGGAATSAEAYSPTGVFIDSTGLLYFTDPSAYCIRVVANQVISTVAGVGGSSFNGDGIAATSAQFSNPKAIWGNAVDGNLYFSASGNNRVRVIASGLMFTVAGTGSSTGTTTEGAAATSTTFASPWGLYGDTVGNILVSQASKNYVRKLILLAPSMAPSQAPSIAPSPLPSTLSPSYAPVAAPTTYLISALAGSGSLTTSGDGGPATAASLAGAQGVFVDSNGIVYICDGDERVRSVTTANTITTFAGGLDGPFDVWVNTEGEAFVIETGGFSVRKVTSDGIIMMYAGNGESTTDPTDTNGDGGPATATQIAGSFISGDSLGSIYVSDTYNHKLRKVTSSGIVTTICGNGSPGAPLDGEAATSALLTYPFGVHVDSSGRVYFVDNVGLKVWLISNNQIISSFAGNGAGFNGDGKAATSTSFARPRGVWADSTNRVYIADNGDYKIRMIQSGIVYTVAGTGMAVASISDGVMATSAAVYDVWDGACDAAGNVIFSSESGLVRKLNLLNPTASPSCAPTISPTALPSSRNPSASPTVLPSLTPSKIPTVAPSVAPTIAPTFSPTLLPSRSPSCSPTVLPSLSPSTVPSVVPTSQAPSMSPSALPTPIPTLPTVIPSVAPSFAPVQSPVSYVVTNFAGTGVSAYNGNGGKATAAALWYGYGVFVDSVGLVYISDGTYSVRTVDSANIIRAFAGGVAGNTGNGGAATSAAFSSPYAAWGDSVGRVYITDSNNYNVRVVATGGIITAVAGTSTGSVDSTAGNGDGGAATAATMKNVYFLSGDSVGNIYLSDNGNNKIRKVDSVGIITSVVGTGVKSATGTGGPATAATINNCYGVLSVSGTLYYVENSGGTIKAVPSSSQILAVFAGLGSGFNGDGGVATSTRFNNPRGIFMSASNTMFVADFSNSRFRSVVSSTVFTIAGNGVSGSSGDDGAATAASFYQPYGIWGDTGGNLYVTGSSASTVRKLTVLTSTATPSVVPTVGPTFGPSVGPSALPSFVPTLVPSVGPSLAPSTGPTIGPSLIPSALPTISPSLTPSVAPSRCPSLLPSTLPTELPTVLPSLGPTPIPTLGPSLLPSVVPSTLPTVLPSVTPTAVPSCRPVTGPSVAPTLTPSADPSLIPTAAPSLFPTVVPTVSPSVQPSLTPSVAPSLTPTLDPSVSPTLLPSLTPSYSPSVTPSVIPSVSPSPSPSIGPTALPTLCPSVSPTLLPSVCPSITPTVAPSTPSVSPSVFPTVMPVAGPSPHPTELPSCLPSTSLSVCPSGEPSVSPSCCPTLPPSLFPTSSPTTLPSLRPSLQPSISPSIFPTVSPTFSPSCAPSTCPSLLPSLVPLVAATSAPSIGPTDLSSQVESSVPSIASSVAPSLAPTSVQSDEPSVVPSLFPVASIAPTMSPSDVIVTVAPTAVPSISHTLVPSSLGPTMSFAQPTVVPSVKPSRVPSVNPTLRPSRSPSAVPTRSRSPSFTPSASPFTPTLTPSVASNRPTLKIPTTSPSSVAYFYSHPMASLPSKQSISVIGPSDLTFKIVIPFLTLVYGPRGTVFNNIKLFGDAEAQATVYLGAENRSATLNSQMFDGAAVEDSSKRSAALLGDVNGDGHNDLIIGDPYAARCYVMFGNNKGLTNMTNGFTIFGSEGDLTGWSVSDAGDVNNDTLSDIVIGAPFAKGIGAVFVIYGRSTEFFDVYLSNLTTAQGYSMYGAQKSDYLGISVSTAGDFNGDGFDDIIVGAVMTSEFYLGAAYVLYGSEFPYTQDIIALNETQAFTMTGESYSYVGYSVSGVGDVNRDGFDDILVGSNPQKTSLAPASYLIYGGKNLNDLSLSATMGASSSVTVIHGSGVDVSSVGDVNHDGFYDFMVLNDQEATPVNSGVIVFANVSFLAPLTEAPSAAPTIASTRMVSKAPVSPSVAPTRNPTQSPSPLPTSPSVVPSVGQTSPSTDPTSGPSCPTVTPSQPPSESPTMQPSVEPSESPSMEPSVRPSRSPTVSSTVEPTRSPSFVQTAAPSTAGPSVLSVTRSPFAAPSIAPTVSSSDVPQYSTVYVTSSGPNDVQPSSYSNYVVNCSCNVSISNSLGHIKYTVLSNPHSTLTIVYFTNSTDLIDLTAFTGISDFSQLLFSEGSIVLTLPEKQIVHILNLHLGELNSANFLLYANPPQNTDNSTTQILSAVAGSLIAIGGLFVVLLIGRRVVVMLKKPVVPEKDVFLMVIRTTAEGVLLSRDNSELDSPIFSGFDSDEDDSRFSSVQSSGIENSNEGEVVDSSLAAGNTNTNDNGSESGSESVTRSDQSINSGGELTLRYPVLPRGPVAFEFAEEISIESPPLSDFSVSSEDDVLDQILCN